MNSVFGFDYQNHIQTENRIKSSVWFGFGKFGSVISSVWLFSRFIRIFRFFCSTLVYGILDFKRSVKINWAQTYEV